MGNAQDGGDTIARQEPNQQLENGIESNQNYVQLSEKREKTETKRNQKDGISVLGCLSKLNCVKQMRTHSLPDWNGFAKYYLKEHPKYSQHSWNPQILKEVNNYQEFKNQQKLCIQDLASASNRSLQNSNEVLSKRKDSWRGNHLNHNSFSSQDSASTNDNHIQEIIQREKKLQEIIENTELLRESVEEQRNSFIQIMNYNQKEKSKSILSSSSNQEEIQSENENVSTSFLSWDSEQTSQENQKQVQEEYDNMFKNLNRYREITRVLQQHMANAAKNPIAHILGKYAQIFCNTYDSDKLNQPHVFLKIITNEINDFLSFLVEILKIYYRIDFLVQGSQLPQYYEQDDMFLSSENLHNFLCTLLFSFEGFNQKINKIYADSDAQIQQQLKMKIDSSQDIKMIELGIKKEFQLDQTHLKQEASSDDVFTIQQPFMKAILYFNKIKATKSPLQKLKIILKTFEIVEQTIKDYYEQDNVLLAFSCDADNFLGIMQYIIIKSRAYNIYSDIKFIENFVQSNSSKSISSYKLITLQGSILHMCQSMNQSQS